MNPVAAIIEETEADNPIDINGVKFKQVLETLREACQQADYTLSLAFKQILPALKDFDDYALRQLEGALGSRLISLDELQRQRAFAQGSMPAYLAKKTPVIKYVEFVALNPKDRAAFMEAKGTITIPNKSTQKPVSVPFKQLTRDQFLSVLKKPNGVEPASILKFGDKGFGNKAALTKHPYVCLAKDFNFEFKEHGVEVVSKIGGNTQRVVILCDEQDAQTLKEIVGRSIEQTRSRFLGKQ